ncbi:MAG: peptidoglycan bridge formation glycyltransferase FemA/FemB family protein [Chitinivibrionales bacterium]|nr:peptidoglycan bridge formation glycyltransferase FemA/FemB family protein [Chitinivibrionales bacterium]
MFEIIDPLTFSGWDREIQSFPRHSFFHTLPWIRTLRESYGYRPYCFVEKRDWEVTTVIPMMEINSVITGKRGVCLPFTDFCAPLTRDNRSSNELLLRIIHHGRSQKWKYIETRGWENQSTDTSHLLKCYEHTLDLSKEKETLYRNLRSSTRRNISKAKKSGVSVSFQTSLDSMKVYYLLNCRTRKHHGLPPQPFSFFKNIHTHILDKNHGFIALAHYENKPVASSIFFLTNDKAYYKYGASDRKYQFTRANNLIMWESILHCLDNNSASFSFGKTLEENTGLMQFKDGWGAGRAAYYYTKLDTESGKTIKYPSTVFGLHNKIFSMTSILLLRMFGTVIYRHMG